MVARLEASHLVEDAKRKDVIFANSITRQGAHEYSGNKRIVQHFVISKYNTIKCEEANQQTTTQLSLICWTSLHPTFFIKSYQLQYTQPFFQVQPKPMASRCSLVLLQRDSNQYLGKDHDSHGSWGIMWPTCVENFDMAIFWFERRLLACCWCMARCFEGKLDICVVGKLGRETLPLKDFLQFFFWACLVSCFLSLKACLKFLMETQKCHIWIGNIYPFILFSRPSSIVVSRSPNRW